MGLNSGDWGNIVGGVVSAYNPALGGQVNSLFQKPGQQPAPSPAIAAPPPVVATVPGYVWVIGGIAGSLLVVFVLFKLTK